MWEELLQVDQESGLEPPGAGPHLPSAGGAPLAPCPAPAPYLFVILSRFEQTHQLKLNAKRLNMNEKKTLLWEDG